MEMQDITQIQQQFDGQSVLVLGDVMLDRYLSGRVARISPEAPVPILEWHTTENRLGGAANVALNVQALGGQVNLVSILGEDASGAEFCKCMEAAGLDTKYLVRSGQRKTTTKTRIMAAQQHLLRIDAEDTGYLNAQEEDLVEAAWEKAWNQQPDVVILQDYDKGILNQALIARIITDCNKKGVPVVVDPKRRQFWDYAGAALFKPNLKELSDALGWPVKPELIDLTEAVRALQTKMEFQQVVVTLGSAGMYVFGDTPQILAPVPIQLSDVCGAGDTVISILALGMAAKLPISLTASLANQGAAWVCTQPGVVPVTWEAWRS